MVKKQAVVTPVDSKLVRPSNGRFAISSFKFHVIKATMRAVPAEWRHIMQQDRRSDNLPNRIRG